MERIKRESKKKSLGSKQIAFVVDGKTERWYISKMKQYHNLNFERYPKLQDGKFDEMYNEVKNRCEDENVDKVVWIVDYDVVMKETREAKSLPKVCDKFDNAYKHLLSKYYEKCVVIVNNPCLEYWYLLHFKETTKYYNGYDAMKADLQKEMPNYEKSLKYYDMGKGIYAALIDKLPIAYKQSRQMHYDKETVKSKGVSEMSKLFDIKIAGKRIIDIINE